jgi:hypothetical protein
MLRAVSESLFRRLLQAFPPDRPYTPSQFEQAPMPPLVALFLQQALQDHLGHEASQIGTSEWFDSDHPGVRRAREAFSAMLAQHGRIPARAWDQALEQAVDQVLQHLVRPTKTLVDFVFEGRRDTLPATTVTQRLAYFGAYPYLREVAEGYFAQKNLQEIDRARFASLLNRVDEQMTADYDADEWLRLLEPLFELTEATPLTAGRGVPTTLLYAFFRDKQADRILERLRSAEEHQGVEMISAAALQRLIDAARRPVEAAPAAAPPQTTPPSSSTSRSPSPAERSVPDDASEDTSSKENKDPIPLWMQFQRNLPPGLPAPPAASPEQPSRPPAYPASRPPRVKAAASESTSDTPKPRWMQFQNVPRPGSPSDTTGLATLEQAVLGEKGARNRDLFVGQLFSSSLAEYERVLQRLQPATSWAQASKIIAQEVFKKNQVNIYSDPAIAFTDAVEARFREK